MKSRLVIYNLITVSEATHTRHDTEDIVVKNILG